MENSSRRLILKKSRLWEVSLSDQSVTRKHTHKAAVNRQNVYHLLCLEKARGLKLIGAEEKRADAQVMAQFHIEGGFKAATVPGKSTGPDPIFSSGTQEDDSVLRCTLTGKERISLWQVLPESRAYLLGVACIKHFFKQWEKDEDRMKNQMKRGWLALRDRKGRITGEIYVTMVNGTMHDLAARHSFCLSVEIADFELRSFPVSVQRKTESSS